MFSIFEWLCGSVEYPRWALCILILTAFCAVIAGLFLLWFEAECRRDQKETESEMGKKSP